MRRILILAALLPLTACASHLAIVRPPADKLVCKDEPGRPVGSGPAYVDANGVPRNAITDADDGKYKTDLRDAGQSCRDDVNWLRDWFANLKD